MNNEAGNVHRICHMCHNKWHRANDADYDWNAGYYPKHDPQPMTEADMNVALLDALRYQSLKQPKIKED